MALLLLGNVEPGTTDTEIREFLIKYGFPPFDAIQHQPGDGSQPSVLVTFTGIDALALAKLRQRIHELYWNNRTLAAQVLPDRSD
jgi:hypothetical protein